MNSKNIATSSPFTIQNYDNYLKDYVNTSGFNWDSKCLEVIFKKLNDNFDKYIQKIGDYNSVSVTSAEYVKQRNYSEKNYRAQCPEGWTFNTEQNECVNPLYDAKPFGGKCKAGRSKLVKKNYSNCPNGPYNDGNWYTNWVGPIDASKYDFSNTNIGKKNNDEGTYCNAGYKNDYSEEAAKYDCENSNGTWVNYYDDPTFKNHSYTCYNKIEKIWETENGTNFKKYTEKQKKDWEKECEAYWPMKNFNFSNQWICKYGDKLDDDISKGNIFKIGTTNSPIEAAKIVLRSNRLIDNYFFMIEDEIFILGKNNNVGLVTSKGLYNDNCDQEDNKKVTLYLINQEFFNMLEKCKIVNDKINDINTNRDMLRVVSNYYNENFIGKQETELSSKEIIKNQNEIINNLTNNYNKKAELYNAQLDLLGKNDKLVEDNNKKLNQQLNDLNAIQNQIAIKDRIIELNEELNKKQIRNKRILIGFFVLLPILGLLSLLISAGFFNKFVLFFLIGMTIIAYIIYIIIIYNQNNVKNYTLKDKRVISKYEKALISYWNKEKKKINNSLSDFVNKECADNTEIINNGKRGGKGGGKISGQTITKITGKTIKYIDSDGKIVYDITDEEESKNDGQYKKNDYIMKSNGPFYYYDGSAPPQQIYPDAIGSIEFNIENKNYNFPKDIDKKLFEIKNPITKFFFKTWLFILEKNRIDINDPKFIENLDIIEYPDADQTPSPYWDSIKLPIISNIDKQYNYLFQSYSEKNRNILQTANNFIIDLWNFIFGDKIPGDVYKKWINKLKDVVDKNKNIEEFYNDYLDEIIESTKFSEKYGNGNEGLKKFTELKLVDFIKTLSKNMNISTPFAKKYIS
jgi:hypothetical protein